MLVMQLQTKNIQIIFQLEIEVAKAADVPFPPPLDEGVKEEMFNDYIVTPPPTPTPEVGKQGVEIVLFSLSEIFFVPQCSADTYEF